MFNRNSVTFIITFFLSLTCSADNLMWERSHELEKLGFYERAATAIEIYMTRGDDKEYALLRYAYLKYKQGEYNDSIDYYDKAIHLNPKSLDAKLGITLPYMAQGRWRQVKVYTRQVLVISDWNYTAHERLMKAEEAMKKWHTLDRHSAELTTVYPNDAPALAYHAHANAMQGDVAVALAAYEKVLMREPEHIEANAYLDDKK